MAFFLMSTVIKRFLYKVTMEKISKKSIKIAHSYHKNSIIV